MDFSQKKYIIFIINDSSQMNNIVIFSNIMWSNKRFWYRYDKSFNLNDSYLSHIHSFLVVFIK